MRIKRENIHIGSSNLFNVSLRNYSQFKNIDGHGYVELKTTYSSIFDSIIGKYKHKLESKTLLGHYAKKIHLCEKLSGNGSSLYKRNCVHCEYTDDVNKAVIIIGINSDKTGKIDQLVVVCNQVVSTVSLGYLKEHINDFIDPVSFISNEKRLAITRLGFGTVNKVV
jgi:hypothetical protein